MEPINFNEATYSLLEAIANQEREIHVDHSRANGPLDLDKGQRAIINKYTFSARSGEDYQTAFDSLEYALSQICQEYLRRIPEKGELTLADWDDKSGSKQRRLVGFSAWPHYGDYDLKGDTTTRKISVSTESEDLEQLFFIYMNWWDEKLNYEVLVQPGEKNELELETEDKRRNHLLSIFKKKIEVVVPEVKPYIPISDWKPTEKHMHQYECTEFSFEIYSGGVEPEEPIAKQELLD